MAKIFGNEDESPIDVGPPNLIEELTKVVNKFMEKNYRKYKWSARVPAEPINVAKWWATVERTPKSPQENCIKIAKNNSEYWKCPYIDYCKYTLGKFLVQPANFQDQIIDAAINGLHWRGEDQESFARLRTEYNKFSADKIKYKQNAFRLMHKFIDSCR